MFTMRGMQFKRAIAFLMMGALLLGESVPAIAEEKVDYFDEEILNNQNNDISFGEIENVSTNDSSEIICEDNNDEMIDVEMIFEESTCDANSELQSEKSIEDVEKWLNQMFDEGRSNIECVQLVVWYYDYLYGYHIGAAGHAKEYKDNIAKVPGTRIKGAVPQKGDILIYDSAQYGHVAIYMGEGERGSIIWHCNYGDSKKLEVTSNYKYNKQTWERDGKGAYTIPQTYWGVIRPNLRTVNFDERTVDKLEYHFTWPSGIIDKGTDFSLGGYIVAPQKIFNLGFSIINIDSPSNPKKVATVPINTRQKYAVQWDSSQLLDLSIAALPAGKYRFMVILTYMSGEGIVDSSDFEIRKNPAEIPAANPPVQNGKIYTITSALSGKVIEVPSGVSTQSKPLNVWDYADKEWQTWTCKKVSNGYTFINTYTGQAMDIRDGSKASAATVQQYSSNGTEAQVFRIVDGGNGKYGLVNINSGLAVDLYGSSTENGAGIKQCKYHGGDNQLWVFKEVTASSPSEDDKENKLNMTLISGSHDMGSSYDFSGSVTAESKITKVVMGITKTSNSQTTTIHTAQVSGNSKYEVKWSKSDVSQLTISDLEVGDYQFTLAVFSSLGLPIMMKQSSFSIVKKSSSQTKLPTVSATTSNDDIGDTYATFRAVVKNPGRLAMTQAGIRLYDENGSLIASTSEYVSKEYKYGTVLYISYDLSELNITKGLQPGTSYGYEIIAVVDGRDYSTGVSWIDTKGSRKPATPKLYPDKYAYSIGDLMTVSWNAVDYAVNGYRVTLYSTDNEYSKTETTYQTRATFTAPSAGFYKYEIVALGYENSDAGQSEESIVVYPNKTVSFIEILPNGEENILKTELVKYSGNATAPQAPSREGWTFQGWSQGYNNVTEDLTIEAIFKRNTYTVKFLNDNGLEFADSTQRIQYEGTAVAPESPQSSRDGYVFVGWDSNEFECVKGNLTINASYVYENPELPIQLKVLDCVREDAGYYIHYNITNYDIGVTRGRVIVLLKTSSGRLISTTESNAFYLGKEGHRDNVEIFVPDSDDWDGTDAAYADVIVVSSFSSSIPISEIKRVNATRDWSDWSTAEPPTGTAFDSRVEYRYQDMSTTTSSAASLNGWAWYNTTSQWGDYGAWSAWSRTAYSESDSRQVETRTVTDQSSYTLRKYYYYKYWTANVGWFYDYKDGLGNSKNSRQEYHELYTGYPGGDTYKFTACGDDDGHILYKCSPKHLYDIEYFYDGGTVTVPAVTHKEYRYRDRQLVYTYHFYKWSDWSNWSSTPITASTTRNVETRTVYRYRTNLTGQDTNAGDQYTFIGNVGSQFAGKQATLTVYKNEEAADYNNEFIGQTTIGEDGSWSFTFNVREPISAQTGDYTVKLGIEGASSLLYVGTIEAPKPVYTVTFRDWDGEEISTQQVVEGEKAVAPEEPYRYGYRFIGWNTGLTNVHDNLEIAAMYERNEYTVIFADKYRDSYITETFYHGDGIVFPEYIEVEGYDFEGWFDEYDEEVTEVTRNMVIYAKYSIKSFIINFYDANGEVVKTETVEYGETVVAPQITAPEGQRFTGWSTYEYVEPKSDLDVYPVFSYNETTLTPEASIKSCTLEEPATVVLSCKDEDATIFYTTDGSEPTSFSNVYDTPIVIDRNMAVKFVAVADNKNYSEIVSEAYLMENAEDDSGALAIKKDKMNILMGDEKPQITYFLYHEDPEMGVQFYSLDDAVVDVDDEGYLYANKVGKTQVFAVTDDYRYADYCEVTVTSDEIPVDSIEITSDDVQMYVGDEADLGTDIKPVDATYKNVTWLTSNPRIASVEDGHIVATGSGIACITAQTENGDNEAYCYVKVEKSTLELSDTNLVVAVGQVYQLNATVRGVIQDVDWKTNNNNAVIVDSTGLLTAVGMGEATILVTAQDGEYRICNVYVTSGEVGANPPEAPTVNEVTDSSVILNEQEGCEYSIGGKEWQDSPVFVGLEPETGYIFYSRVKATLTLRASSASKGLLVTTNEATIEVSDISSCVYTGSAIKPVFTVTYKGEVLTNSKDYKVTYSNNTKASTTAPKITIKGSGYYSGTVTKSFVIEPKNISDDDIVSSELIAKANNSVQKLKPTLTYGKLNLKLGTDYTLSYPDTTEGAYKVPGAYTVLVTGIKNFTGTKELQMVISVNNLISKAKITAPAASKYDGEVHMPDVKVMDKSTLLVRDEDYELVYPDTSEGAYCLPGTYEIIVKGIGAYAGTKKVSFKINAISISGAKVSGIEPKVTYTGSEIEMDELSIVLGEDNLTNNVDYSVSYTKNINVGKASMVIKGIGGYSGSIKKTFSITAYDISKNIEGKFSEDNIPDIVVYAKGGAVPNYEFSFEGETLNVGTDYTISLANNKSVNAGSKIPKATISGKGNFTGKLSYTFTIVEQDISELDVVVADIAYKSKKDSYKATPTVYDLDGKKLVKGTDYEKTLVYTYADGSEIAKGEIPEAGSEITVTITAKGNYEGTIEATYRIAEKSISKIKYSKIKKSYTGRSIQLRSEEIVLKDGSKVLVEGVDYEIVEDSYSHNVNPGTATVTVRGLGSYYGTLTIKYTISKKKLFG